MSQISFGTITIVDTTDIQRFYVEYTKSNSSAAAPTTGWSQDRPTWQNGTYIWQRTVIKKQDVVQLEYGSPVCITGEKGQTGQQGIQGNTGKGIFSIVTTYCNYGTGTPAANYSGWNSSVPEYDKNKPNYWVKTTVNYTTGNPSVTIYKDLGITEAAQKANLAASVAQTAESNSLEAISIAGSKNKIYYSTSFPVNGNYINGDTLFYKTSNGTIMYVYDSTYNDSTSGHWRQQQFEENAISDLAITNAKIKNLSGDKIIANTIASDKIVSHSITAVQLATDAIKSTNYNAGTAPYSLTGTFLDLTTGNIYTPNFGVNNDSTDNIADGAYIRGTIQAYDGKIGSDSNNYWYIGNYFDYNQGQSAMLRSHGTAAIQLGDSSTWRVSTDRIHTAWNDDSTTGQAFRLHYPSYGGKYWDSGLHVPTSATDKLLYIRNANTTVSLENLQNDINDNSGGNYWNYQFYLTNDGSLYAKNIYIMDDSGNTTQIGGTDGVYLLKSGGTITGNLTVNGTLTATASQANALTHTLSINGQSWTGSSNLTINTLGTAYGGTGNTSYTTGGVVYVDGSNPKKLLSTAAGTSGYLLKSSGAGAPTWVDPGTLTVAAADKATKDGDGNVIKTTYLKLTGGNVTGPVSFGDSVSIDDLSAGTLVVTGNASFTNNIQANTINGVTVGSNPKFTDTVTTISTEGNGNAITAIESTNGILKAIKGATFLMNISSSQVTSALGYTPYNATNPNGYTTNTGTVTSVAASGSGGITISGSPITTSGTLTIGLNLSTAINGLGEGTSAANRNDYAVVQYAGGGTSTTTYHRRKLSNVFKALIADDIPNLAWSKITSGNDDLKAIEALEGTSGLLKKTAANTWTLDTNAYVTSSGVTSITLTQGTGISIGFSGTAITSTGTRTISLADNYGDTKNPYASKTARYVLAAPAAANGVPSFRALTKEDVGLNNVLNYSQVTAIGQGDNGTLRVWTGDPTSTSTDDYEDIAITITAYNQSTVSKAGALNLSAAIGSTSKPVYFKADGKPYEISYTIEKSVPSNAVFTDTWNKVSTSQDGYVTKLPGNTTTFLRGDGTWGTPGGTYSLPLAANGTRGGVQIGYSSSGKNYAVQLSSEKMYVNVPWTDTTYSAGTGLSLSGTTFNHSNSVTAGTAGTSSATSSTNRTIAIPYLTYDAQGHITGSGTHTHTLDSFPEAYLAWGGRNIASDITPIGMSISTEHNANRIAFLNPAAIQIEYTTDGGSTWTDSGYTDGEKMWLCTGGQNIAIGQSRSEYSQSTALTINHWTRITLTGQNGVTQYVYTNPRKLLINMSTALGVTCLIEYKTGVSNAAWQTFGTYTVSGWSGWNDIPLILSTFGGGTTQTGNNWYLRFTFKISSTRTDNYKGYALVCGLRLFGTNNWGSASSNNGKGVISSTGHLYSYDTAANATFPAQITAIQFNGKLNNININAVVDSFNTGGWSKLNGLLNDSVISVGQNSSMADWNGQAYSSSLVFGCRDTKGLLDMAYSMPIVTFGGTNIALATEDKPFWYFKLSGTSDKTYTLPSDSKTLAATDGSNATGNWDISITGNAATATSAISATTASKLGSSNVGATDRPIYLSAGTATQTTYRMAVTNTVATTARAITDNLETGIWYINGTNSTDLYSQADGVAYVNKYSDNWIHEIYGDYRTGQIAVRSKNNGTWQPWRKILDSSNYINYMGNYVTLTTEQTISGRKTFENIAAVTFKPSSGTDNCSINYDSTLGALVFSF